ncbi:hypothetical protein FHS82_003416 [Pseudochelatococcus lubricantis]|uniref:Fido domain-containing protein n=1 Tax=Pseudochelatococcus lubricantis TaxID=1538102 RepID=A0ABX0V329_9HYPH|nr:hypothetical protein [Pseudochelatococcus lubricantis]NIJ59558.1 hypothetical protein [Pseudochelatococcus lubricantis]
MRLVMNLQEVEVALAHLMTASAKPDTHVFDDKEPLSDDVVRRMISGYAHVNDLLRTGVNLFDYGCSSHWLELNHLVLCGTTPGRREQFRDHIEQTERRFYDDSIGGIGERIEWLRRHRSSAPEALAAGIFLHITSAPQLFIEGNRRTATLIASYALVSHARPPLVVTDSDYQAFFSLTDDCKHIHRDRWDHFLSYYAVSYRIERFLRKTADGRYLTTDGGDPG